MRAKIGALVLYTQRLSDPHDDLSDGHGGDVHAAIIVATYAHDGGLVDLMVFPRHGGSKNLYGVEHAATPAGSDDAWGKWSPR